MTAHIEKRLLRLVSFGGVGTHDADDTSQPSLAVLPIHQHGRAERTHAESVGKAAATRHDANRQAVTIY